MALKYSDKLDPDYSYISDPDDSLKCCICLEVARDPKQEEGCGKLFCRACIDEWEEEVCPTCKTETPRYFMDKKSYREIQALGVKCNNVGRGCNWEGSIGTLQNHTDDCDYQLVTCPNECSVFASKTGDEVAEKCIALQVLKKDLEEHLYSCPERQYQCQDCGLKDKYRVIVGPHEEECEKKVISCPNNNCKISVERGNMQNHIRKSCDFTEVYCKFANIGCEVKMIRKDIKQHEKDNEHHFPIALGKISELNDIIAQRVPLMNKEKRTQITFKLVNFQEKKKQKLTHEFKPFFTSAGYRICFMVYANGTNIGKNSHISVFTKILSGPHDDNLEWPFKGTITVELLNQNTDLSHHKEIIRYDKDAASAQPGGGGWGRSEFISHENLMKSAQNYLIDDSMFFRLTVEQKNYKPWLAVSCF